MKKIVQKISRLNSWVKETVFSISGRFSRPLNHEIILHRIVDGLESQMKSAGGKRYIPDNYWIAVPPDTYRSGSRRIAKVAGKVKSGLVEYARLHGFETLSGTIGVSLMSMADLRGDAIEISSGFSPEDDLETVLHRYSVLLRAGNMSLELKDCDEIRIGRQ